VAKLRIPFHAITGRILPPKDGPTGLWRVQMAISEMARVLFTILGLRRRGLDSSEYELPEVRMETVGDFMGSLQLARTECRSAGIDFSAYDPTLTEAKRMFFDGLSRIPECGRLRVGSLNDDFEMAVAQWKGEPGGRTPTTN
jgi:hypothetical protein